MDYTALFTNAWRTLRQKALWPFALLVTLSQGLGSVSNVVQLALSPETGSARLFPWLARLAHRLEAGDPGLLILLFLFVIGLALFMITAYYFGQASLVRGITRHTQGETTLTFKALTEDGLQYMGQLFLLTLTLGLLALILFISALLVGALLGVLTMGLALLCLIPLALVLALLWYAFQKAVELALLSEGRSIGQAFSRGWQIFRSRFWSWLSVVFIEGFIGFLMSLPLIVPLYFFVFLALQAAEQGRASLFLLALTLIAGYGLVVLWPAWAAVDLYRTAFRTLGYLELAAQSATTTAISPTATPELPSLPEPTDPDPSTEDSLP